MEMFVYPVHLVLVFLIIKGPVVESAACDSSRVPVRIEGTLGQTRAFPWLGVLRVYLRQDQEPSFKVALTGIVYVKEGYAIGNADDIVRIPKRIFHEDSHAMFIPRDYSPWYCRLVDYMTHPDYEEQTLSSIALIELDPGEDTHFPMKPVCWPAYGYNASNQLYAVGFTDENQVLEKFIYNLQYLKYSLCEEFYNRSGLVGGKLAPLHYECGFARNKSENCVWDNGIALVSNATGPWKLLGLGLHGPGCAAPARFIDLLTYYPWIESSTTFEEGSYRKSAFNYGFRPRPSPNAIQNIPAHELLRSYTPAEGKHDYAHWYPFPQPHLDDLFYIERVHGTEIIIHRANATGMFGDCENNQNKLVYKDNIEVKAPGPGNVLFGRLPRRGTVRYRLALYDLLFMNYTCVIIKAITGMGKDAYLHYSTKLEGGDLFPETPKEIIRVYPYHSRQKFSQIEPYVKEDKVKNRDFYTLNLYLKYNFINLGRLHINVYGIEKSPIFDMTTYRPTLRRAFNNLLVESDPKAQISVRTKDVKNSRLKDKVVSLGRRLRSDLFVLFSIFIFL